MKRLPPRLTWKGRLSDLYGLWPAAHDTWDARVDEAGSLTLTHKDGTKTVVEPGHQLWIVEGRLVKSGEEPSEISPINKALPTATETNA